MGLAQKYPVYILSEIILEATFWMTLQNFKLQMPTSGANTVQESPRLSQNGFFIRQEKDP